MKGVLLINMGAPESESEVKHFLRLIFLDKHIIPAPYFIRNLLSLYISKTRYKKSWARYKQIGGTPLKKNTLELANALQNKIGNNYSVKVAYSYSVPYIHNVIKECYNNGIKEIIAIPLYPQYSITTTESVKYALEKIKTQYQNITINTINEFYSNNLFIDYWNELITNHIKTNNLSKPFLLFSAHSIPLSFIKKGDTYQKAIEGTAKLISKACELNYSVSYQSQMNEKTWLGPCTQSQLNYLKNNKIKEVVIIPISFVCENLETKYDLDIQIVPQFNPLVIGSKDFNVSRIEIPAVNEKFVEMLISFL